MDLSGQDLGKYQNLEEIGRGGMGIVYKAYDASLDRYVAIKVLAAHLLGEEEFVQRFLREARAAAKLDHPNIVTIHEVGQEGDVYFFVMAHLPGRPLDEIIEDEGRLAQERVLSITQQVAAALDYAHRRGFVHRDVKPSNIVVDEDGRAVLTDFGLVRPDTGARLTRTGVMLGTPEYISPEQAMEEETTPASDLYALGVVVYEMLAGETPFHAQTPLGVLMKHVKEAPPSLREKNPDVSAELEQAVLGALAKDPRARPASGATFVAALEAAIVARPPAEAPPSAVEAAAPAQPEAVPAVVAASLATPPEAVAPEPAITPAVLAPSPPAVISPTPTPVQPGQPYPPEEMPPAAVAKRGWGVPFWAWIIAGVGVTALVAVLLLTSLDGEIHLTTADETMTAAATLSEEATATVPPEDSPSPVIIVATSPPTEAPTGAATPHPTAPPIVQPTETPLPTDIPPPTDTPLPTNTIPPTDTPVPTATPTPTCPPVSGPFATIWEAEQDRLGCALEEAHTSWVAQEHFESGQMLWREDTDGILVLYSHGSWAAYPDTWNDGDPLYSCPESAPEESPPTPIRGFGKVWCTYAEVRSGLGWATDLERGFYGTVQDFERGAILRTDTGETIVLFGDSTWTHR